MNKKYLLESDLKAKFITPAIFKTGWDGQTQLGREIFFKDGRIYVKGKLTARETRKFVNYIPLSRNYIATESLKSSNLSSPEGHCYKLTVLFAKYDFNRKINTYIHTENN